MARPTKYKQEFIKKADEYLELNKDEMDSIGDKLIQKVKLPTIGGFALFINVPESTLYDWKKEGDNYKPIEKEKMTAGDIEKDKELQSKAKFSESLGKIKQEQQSRLLNKGLSGDYNPTIAKLILSSNHGMSDKVDTDVTTLGESINNISYENAKNIIRGKGSDKSDSKE